jgi:dihydropyrimidinase
MGRFNGRVIQTVATDHCPFFYNGREPIVYEGKPVAIPGKELGADNFTKIPNGLPGVGDRLPVMWTAMVNSGKFSMNQFVELMSTNPARIFGMYPEKGTLLPGSDADIVLWDANKKVKYGQKVAQHRTDYNLYENMELTDSQYKYF